MYSALYRRLRPRVFGDIIGQDHIVRTLRNQIAAGKVSHAYLFCGSRGTGKTSAALVFAKAINCEGADAPCQTCAACVAIARGGGFNVIEIDAASNNGVDNIRDIREEVKYPPANGRYKVYIIDEVHMLSASAFNALLKTLEEPPAGVIFILATTDPQKIPATVLSRCQRFDFRRIPSEIMASAITPRLAAEGILCDEEAVRYAARAAEGSMRDTLSVIDQCAASFMGETINLARMMEVMGATGTEDLRLLLAALADSDAARGLSLVDASVKDGKDVHQVVSEFLAYLRDVLIAVTAGDQAAQILDLPEENVSRLREGVSVEPRALMGYITAFGELIPKMRYAVNARILLEAGIIGLCGNVQPAVVADVNTNVNADVKADVNANVVTDVNAESAPGELGRVVDDWGGFVAGFGALERSILGAVSVASTGNTLRIFCQNQGTCDILKTKRDGILARLKEKYGLEANLEFILRRD